MELNALGKLLVELNEVASAEKTQSAEWWLDRAQRLAAMWPSVMNKMINDEMAYKKEIVENIKNGDSVAAATLKVEAESKHYHDYLYCKGKDKQIAELIKLAKKRVEAERTI